jgi:bifunctional non-homologous end joining protein LigD
VDSGRPQGAEGRTFAQGRRAEGERTPRVRIFSRLGNEKSAQFPELVQALAAFGEKLPSPVIIDGEIVALDEQGEPAGFQRLQGRIHLTTVREADTTGQPVALIAFDLLCEGRTDLCGLPLTERRTRLERVFAPAGARTSRRSGSAGSAAALETPSRSTLLRLSGVARGDGRLLFSQAKARGWEGLIVKRANSPYQPGKRTPDWRKLKLVRRQEFVVGGWTEPRASRSYFGALLLGYYDDGVLKYAGHTGSGFDQKELARVWKLLRPLETTRCPFATTPKTNERPHWVEPELVAEVKFSEWTDEGMLRHPIYLGLREDVKAETVRREPMARLPVMTAHTARPQALVKARPAPPPLAAAPLSGPGAPPPSAGRGRRLRSSQRPQALSQPVSNATRDAALRHLHDELQRIEADRGEGVITLPGNVRMTVTNLKKVFWPKGKITKGALMRYYVTVAPYLLPVVEDRPLVMKRFPNGVSGKAFYQQRAPDSVPAGVRVEKVEGDKEVPARLIGGSLATLLYMTQLAAISQDPWFSRVQSPHVADHAAIDLDPGEGVPFARVLDTARWVRDELETLGVRGFPKTSGADGLHIYVPLEPGTPYEAGMIFCQIIATMVAEKHPKVATVERRVRTRGRTVYVDYLQNIEGKTLACAYSARASDYAGASTPLTWTEIDEGLDRRDFTIRTLPGRLKDVGDLWAGLRKAKGTNLRAVEKYAKR